MTAMLFELMLLSVFAPQRAGRIVLKVNVPPRGVAELVALVIVLSSMAILLNQLVSEPIPISAVTLILMQVMTFAVMILATFLVGKMFGGTGSLIDTIVILCWMNLVVAMFQFAQILLSAFLKLLPWLGSFGTFAESLLAGFSLFLFIWLYVHFVKVLHSFDSALKVLGGMLLTIFVIAFGAVGVMTLFFA